MLQLFQMIKMLDLKMLRKDKYIKLYWQISFFFFLSPLMV